MCGIFGYVANENEKIDMGILAEIATVTMSRGKHAWGLAWIDRRGRMMAYKQSGRIVDSLGLLNMARNARVLIGHCRYATQGDPEDNINNHPFACDGGWIVHNGMIKHYESIILEEDLYPTTDCDSEVLAMLIERLDGAIENRCHEAADFVESRPLAMLGLWKPGKIVAVKNGNPLHVGRHRTGTYLASLASGLPGKVSSVADGMRVFEYHAPTRRSMQTATHVIKSQPRFAYHRS